MLPRSEWLDIKLLHKIAIENERLELRQQDKRQKHESADECAVKQDRDDGIIDYGLLFEDVVEAQQEG